MEIEIVKKVNPSVAKETVFSQESSQSFVKDSYSLFTHKIGKKVVLKWKLDAQNTMVYTSNGIFLKIESQNL